MTSELPTIFVIDDDLPDASAIAGDLVGQPAVVLPRTPDSIEADELESAQLVVVDYRLDKWQERDSLGNPGLKPMNGLALIEVLRSHLLAKRVERGDTPPGFVLYSGDDDAFPEARLRYGERHEHLIARLTNLDWFVFKGRDQPRRKKTLLSLAAGFSQLGPTWPDASESEIEVYRLLGLGDKEPWEVDAREDVVTCFGPIHGDISQVAARHRSAAPFIRWLLHRILPYPSCLWPIEHVAAHLRMEVEGLAELIKTGTSELSEELGKVRYMGPFNSLLGDRWWKAGVTDLVWRLTDGNPFSGDLVNRRVSEAAGSANGIIAGTPVVPVLNEDFDPAGELSSVDSVVRLQLDEWPSFATLPVIRIETVDDHPDLKSYVLPDDRHRIEDSNG
ncbi:MAG: hypothetical protein OXD50_10480 [Chloroflexi bacterium]|nr:hypothetical protein [Chloroflexota bacterium]